MQFRLKSALIAADENKFDRSRNLTGWQPVGRPSVLRLIYSHPQEAEGLVTLMFQCIEPVSFLSSFGICKLIACVWTEISSKPLLLNVVEDSVHRRFNKQRHDALHDGADQRVSDGIGQNARLQGLYEHQRQPDNYVFHVLSSVLAADRSTASLWRVT